MPVVYAVLADLQERFAASELVQLTDDAGAGTIDEGRIDQALASASALVEGYVAATYALDPVAPVPVLLVDCTCDIARFRLYRTAPPEDVTTRNAQAVRQLEGIRSGKIKLDQGVEALTPRPGKVLVQSGSALMSRNRLAGF